MNPDPTLELFFQEADELLRDFEEGVLRLERSGGDPETLNRVFRSAHTLKGNSSMLGFDAIAGFTHVLENLLASLREDDIPLAGVAVSTLLSAADVLGELLRRARDGDDEEEEEEEEPRLRETTVKLEQLVASSGLPAAAAVASARSRDVPPASGTRYEIRFQPRAPR